MTSITISYPSPEEEERNRRFQVHKNYLGAINLYLAEEHGWDDGDRPSSLLESQQVLKGYQKIRRRSTDRPQDVRRFLMLSWVSEAQLRVHDSAEGTILPYANAWAPIHSYYAVYMASVALLAAQGHEEASNHRAFLSATSQLISQRKLLPLPWSVSAAGCPDIGETEWSGLPVDADPTASVELLSNPISETFWPRFCKMLETTRKRRLRDRYRAWCKQNNRKITRKPEKRRIAANLPPTTLFDFFWRLRVRSNYQDVDTFLMSSVGEAWHRDFYESISAVTEATCLLFESLVIRCIGPEIYERAIEDFRSNGGPLAEEIVGRRARLLLRS